MSPADDVRGREAWLRRGPATRVDAVRGGIRAARAAAAGNGRVARDAPGPGTDWVPLGPTQATAGMAADRPPVTGRIRGLAVSPDGTRAYAGTANGGVWATEDGGERWRALDPWRDTPNASVVSRGGGLAIGSIAAVFGATAQEDVLYAGCGEPGGWSGDGVRRYARPDPASPRAWATEAPGVVAHATYRVVVPPAGAPNGTNRVWVASDQGLLERPLAAPFEPWAFVDPALTGTIVTDVAMLVDGATEWLYVAVWGDRVVRIELGPTGSAIGRPLTVCLGIGQNLTAADRNALGRISLATAPDGARRVYALMAISRGSQRARLRRLVHTAGPDPRFRSVSGCPGALWLVNGGDQGDYDQALAIVPQPVPAPATAADEVVVGGSTVNREGDWQAALYRGPVGGTATAPSFTATWRGSGAHADVHCAAFSRRADNTIDHWIGTDGGIYRANPGVDGGRFAPAHGGMNVFQLTHIASHPQVPAFLLGGSQDNGMLIHSGEVTWRRHTWAGDAGGVAVDATTPRWMWQYTRGSLYSDTPPALRSPPGVVRFPSTGVLARRTAEGREVPFYSPLETVLVPGAPALTRVAFAAHRVWTTDDWGKNWVSWPSGTNPAAAAGQFTNDQLDGSRVEAMDWASPTVLLVVTQQGVYRLQGIGAAGATGDVYARQSFTAQSGLKRTGEAPNVVPPAWATADTTTVPPGTPDDLPELFNPVCVAAGDAAGASAYLGLNPGNGPDEFLWYLPPGATRWLRTGLRAFLGGATTVHAVLVDPANRADVYVGTDVGVYRATRNDAAAPPTWPWQNCSGGLPEAAVQDLDLFAPAGSPVRLLRCSTFGRGVWELDVERITGRNATPPREPEVFLRAAATDDGRRIPGVFGLVDPIAAPGPPAPGPVGIAESPDIAILRGRARVAPPWPGSVTGAANGPHRLAWRIAAATWGRRLPITTDNFGNADKKAWQAIQAEMLLPTTSAMNERTWRRTFKGLDPARDPDHVQFVVRHGRELAAPPSRWLAADAGPNRVFVQVRTRGPDPVAAGRTSVILLWQPVVAAPVPAPPPPPVPPASHTTVVLPPLPEEWRRKVRESDTAGLASAGWNVALPAAAPAGALEPESPFVVGIDVSFPGRPVGSLVALVAIVQCVDDLLPLEPAADRNLLTVVPAESRVALRVVEIA